MSQSPAEEYWNRPRVYALCRAMRAASTEEGLLKRFLQDLWTSGELTDFANRWAAAEAVLSEVQDSGSLPKRSQTKIARDLKISPNVVNHAAKLVRGPEGAGGFVDTFQLVRSGAMEPARCAGEE